MINSFDPARPGVCVASVPVARPDELDTLIDAAVAARPGWAGAGPSRCAALAALADSVERRAAEAAELIAREVGKPIGEARGEVVRAVAILRYYAEAALDPDGETFPSPDGRSTLTSRRDPLGVVLAICPWNFPLAIPLWKAAPALAYGNAAIVKPAGPAVATAAFLAECAEEALPPGVLSVAFVPGRDLDGMLDDRRIDAATFTGSTEVGLAVIGRLAARGAPAQAEMGGHNPAIVLEDADVERAAEAIIAGAMGYAGQKCTATRRAIVLPGIREAMLEALASSLAGVVVGDPLEESTVAGPLIDTDAVEAFGSAVAAGLDAGAAEIAQGGVGPGGGHYVPPTVLALDDCTARVNTEETFGPLLTVLEARDAYDAVRIANSTRFGLVGAVHSRDIARATAIAERLSCGMIRVNAPTPGVDYYAPFGGAGASGYGPREQGKAAREFFTRQRTLLVSPG